MNTPHPDKALIDAITSGVPMELQDPVELGWRPASSAQHALDHGAAYGWEYVRPEPADTHRKKTVRYPVPMQVMPENSAEYWLVEPAGVVQAIWSEHYTDTDAFNQGRCYEIHREAEAREAWQARFGGDWK